MPSMEHIAFPSPSRGPINPSPSPSLPCTPSLPAQPSINSNREFVHEDGLTALELVEGTDTRKDIQNGVVVFDAVVGDEWEGDVAVVGVDAFVPLGGFGVGVDGEELRGDGCGVHSGA